MSPLPRRGGGDRGDALGKLIGAHALALRVPPGTNNPAVLQVYAGLSLENRVAQSNDP